MKFSDIAKEIIVGRIYLGIHFRFADTEARSQGRRVANHTFKNILQPVGKPTSSVYPCGYPPAPIVRNDRRRSPHGYGCCQHGEFAGPLTVRPAYGGPAVIADEAHGSRSGFLSRFARYLSVALAHAKRRCRCSATLHVHYLRRDFA